MPAPNTLKKELDLAKIKSLPHLIREMRKAFEFPSYFGGNLNALDDCMRDLQWFHENHIEITFLNLERIKSKNAKLYQTTKEILLYYQEFWQDNPQKSVKIIFHG